jgi:hypothetical protein
MATPKQKAFCVLQFANMNQLFLFSGPSGDNLKVIPHPPTALGVGISSSRQRGVFVTGKVQDVRHCQKKVWKE